MYSLWPWLLPETMLMFVGGAAARGHTDLSSLHLCLRPWWCLGRCSQWGPCLGLVFCCCQGLCWCQWTMSPLRFLWMSIVWDVSEGLLCVCGLIAAGSHVCGLYCHRKPCGSPWSVFPLTVKSNKVNSVVISLTADVLLRKKEMEGFCDNPCPPQIKVIA